MRLLYFLLSILFVSCSADIKVKEFPFFLSEPCMIINLEQDNTIEGTHFLVQSIDTINGILSMELPSNFYISNKNCQDWLVGWGDNMAYYDAGVENIRSIGGVDSKGGTIEIGESRRGKGYPKDGEQLVFWNTKPSGFKNYIDTPIVSTTIWPQFAGKSISFGGIVYDSISQSWVLFVNEWDISPINLYVAVSKNLIEWKPYNNGNPIFSKEDIAECSWCFDQEGKKKTIPYISDIVYCQGEWYLLFTGYDNAGNKNMGVAYAKSPFGTYTFIKEPIITEGEKNTWNAKGSFYGKVVPYNNGFILFYDGVDDYAVETLGVAYSNNMLNWEEYDKNPVIYEHFGWRSNTNCSEPSNIFIRNDTIFVLESGVKLFKEGVYKDLPGNVDDNQLGVFMSTDGGRSFIPHKHNPVIVNNYSNPYENGHMGPSLEYIKTDTLEYLFYQAKSSYESSRYNLMLKVRPASN